MSSTDTGEILKSCNSILAQITMMIFYAFIKCFTKTHVKQNKPDNTRGTVYCLESAHEFPVFFMKYHILNTISCHGNFSYVLEVVPSFWFECNTPVCLSVSWQKHFLRLPICCIPLC